METDWQYRSHGSYINDYPELIAREGEITKEQALQMVKEYYENYPQFTYNENTYFLNKCFLFTHCDLDEKLTGVYQHDFKWYRIGSTKSAMLDHLTRRSYQTNPLPVFKE